MRGYVDKYKIIPALHLILNLTEAWSLPVYKHHFKTLFYNCPPISFKKQ